MDRALGGGDENHMLLYFGYSHLQYIATTYFDASNHIFHTMLVNLMGRWFGEENAIAIRLPTFLFGVACLWMTYKVAWEIFASKKIALMALLIAAVNPVHIYYSQTARGYSLMMFFSTAVVYVVIMVLKSKPNLWHALLLTSCCFLSVYTLPTNIFFLLSLAGWLLTVILSSSWSRELGLDLEERRQRVFWFGGSAFFIILFILLSYLPVLDQLTDTARNHSLQTFDTQSALASSLLTAIFDRIFQGPLKWFLPFLLVGLIYGRVQHKPYRLLPIFIFLLPLIITAVTGVGGFPRNYLFNFSLFVIFLAAGFSVTGDFIERRFVEGRAIVGVLVAVYSLVSLGVVFFEHYPSIKTPDGDLYRQKILQNSRSNDLLIINDTKDYLYARSTYKSSIQKILQENKLARVNYVKQSTENLEDKESSANKDIWSLFKNIFKEESLYFRDVSGGKKMAVLSDLGALPILPDNFGLNADWEVINGKGEISITLDQGLTGESALKLTASPQGAMIIKASVPGEYKFSKHRFIVVVLATKNFNPRNMAYHPLVTADIYANGKLQKIKLHTKKINDGINLKVKSDLKSRDGYYWDIKASIGILPPGSYKFELYLKCHEGNSVLYDGLRMFLAKTVQPQK